jgi:aspartate/methionine/tyrosine aminotransferase
LTRPKLCFTLNGISKMFALPALKLSWIAVSGEAARVAAAVDRLETIADTFLSSHIPIQEALPGLFAEGKAFQRGYHAEVARRRGIALELLRDISGLQFHEPQGGFYLTAAVDPSIATDEEAFVIGLLEAEGVFVHPGYFYDEESGVHLVLSFLTGESELRAGLTGLKRFIHKR